MLFASLKLLSVIILTLAVIARVNHLQRLVVVSDGIHMFRLHAICAADGLDVLTSPRPRIVTEEKSRDSE